MSGLPSLGGVHGPTSLPLAANGDSLTLTIGQTVRIGVAGLLANDTPGASFLGILNVDLPGGVVQDVPLAGAIDIADTGSVPHRGSFDYQITDGTATATASVTLNVTNHAPVAAPFTIAVVPGTSVTVTVDEIVRHVGNADADGDPLRLWALGNPVGTTTHVSNRATLDGSGTIVSETYRFDSGYTGGAVVNFGISDGHPGGVAFSTLNFVVAPTTLPTVSFSGTADATEGTSPGAGGTLVFHVSRSGDLTTETAVTYRLGASAGGNSAAADDLAGGFGDGSVTFAAGQDHLDIGFPIAPDATAEPDERVQLDLLTITGGSYGATIQSTAIILNDDGTVLPPPSVSIAAAADAPEGTPPGPGGMLVFHLTRTGDLSAATTVGYLVDASPFGTAASADDLAAGFGTGSVTFAPGDSTAQVAVAIVPDATIEPDERVRLSLATITGGDFGGTIQATATILDDDYPVVTISHTSDAFEDLGNPLGGTLYFDLTRSGTLAAATTVVYALTGGTAQSDDIAGGFGPGSVTFAPGESTKRIAVAIVADSRVEPDETVALSLDGITGGRLGATAVATAAILDDDNRPVVQVAGVDSSPEGSPPSPGGTGVYHLHRTGDLSGTTTVEYSLGGGTARFDDVMDGLGGGSVSFAPGQTDATVTLTWLSDLRYEEDETVPLTLIGITGGVLGVAATGVATIQNDDHPRPAVIRMQEAHPDIAEGTAPGAGAVITFTIHRSFDLVDEQIVSYVVRGTRVTFHDPFGPDTTTDPLNADDFTGGFGAGTVTFAANQDLATVTLQLVPDAMPERDETVEIVLTGVTGGAPGAQLGELLYGPGGIAIDNQLSDDAVIRNDDAGPLPYPTLGLITGGNVAEGTPPGAGGELDFIITRTGDLSFTTIASYTISTATFSDIDASSSGAVTFAPGEARKTVAVAIRPDAVPEADSAVSLTVSDAIQGIIPTSGGGIFGPPRTTLVASALILNDDVYISAHDDATEGTAPGAGGVLQFTLHRSAGDATTIDYAIGPGTAQADDIEGGFGTGSVSFAAGQTDAVVSIHAIPDALGELNETVTLTLTDAISNPFDSRVPTESVATILNDDGPPLYQLGTPRPDTLIGSAGNDTLDGAADADDLVGGLGDDTFLVDTQADLVFENPGAGTDTVITTTGFYLYANIENLTLASGAGPIYGVGNDLANTITGNESDNLIIAWDGNDTVLGGAGNDDLFGLAGDDSIDGGPGADTILGGDGNDTLTGGDGADELYGEAGDDSLMGGSDSAFDLLVGGDGNDTLDGASGQAEADYLYGGPGDDVFRVDTRADLVFEFAHDGIDTVLADIPGDGYYLYDEIEDLTLLGATRYGVGNALANRLLGDGIGNLLIGGEGDDTLDGMAGNDVLFGQGGADTFTFRRGTGGDVIGDFVSSTDKIALLGLGFTSFEQVQAALSVVGPDSAIDLAYGDFVVIDGVTSFAATDFLFA